MVVRKRGKSSCYRGSHTHGGGAKKKRRGAGHRGGRGNAGSGKRGDSKKPTFQKMGRVFGKHGFKLKVRTFANSITVEEVDARFGQDKNVDLTEKGYTKLLGSGFLSHPLHIKVESATQKAIEKVKAKGGSVEIPSSKEESAKKQSK